MAAFLYWYPGTQPPSRATLTNKFAHAGIADAPGRDCTAGPDDTAGHVFALTAPVAGGVQPRVGYYPDTQTWKRIPDSPMWLGIQNDAPPHPDDLARHAVLGGTPVPLNDGNQWVIPIVRRWSDGGVGNAVEAPFSLTTDGRITFEHATGAYGRLWRGVELLFDKLYAARHAVPTMDQLPVQQRPAAAAERLDQCGPQSEFDNETGYQLACDVLALHYRVALAEVAFLELCTTRNSARIWCAMFDIPYTQPSEA